MEDRQTVIDPGTWLASECRELGVTLHHVAIEARMSPSTLHRWTTGSTSPYWHAFERVRGVLSRMRAEKGRKVRESAYWGERDERRGA